MARSERRIVLATIAVFVALGGMTSSITGLLYDRPLLVHIGATAMVIGVISFVWLLRPGGGTDE
jgi:membrane associated rhomboid family serine protease